MVNGDGVKVEINCRGATARECVRGLEDSLAVFGIFVRH